jgi:hypothetical protein
LPNVFAPSEKLFKPVVQEDTPPVFAMSAPVPLPKAASAAAAVAASSAVFVAVPTAPFKEDVSDEKKDGFAADVVAAGLVPNPKLANILILLSSQILRNELRT